MKLIIGGMAQGKKEYACKAFCLRPDQVLDGAVLPFEQRDGIAALEHLELLVRRLLDRNLDPCAWLEVLCRDNPDIVLLCREVGCGVVPVLQEERDFREAVGRVCCLLAKQAEAVIRVQCGLGMVLKGELL